VFRLEGRLQAAACTEGLSAEECKLHGGVNIVMHHRATRARSAPSAKGTDHAEPTHVVLLLIDSMANDAFDGRFPRTLAALSADGGDGGGKWVRLENHSALGAHSAVNHAGLMLGPGRMPEKCAMFKTSREGIPQKRDGSVYRAYQQLRRSIYLAHSRGTWYQAHATQLFATPPTPSDQSSWLRRQGPESPIRRLTSIFYPIPQPAWEASCMGLFNESSWREAAIADTVAWEFYNEAVTMESRELRGWQGCIAQRHSVDWMADFVRQTAAASAQLGGVPTTLVLADQTAHQKSWGPSAAAGPLSRLDASVSALLSDPTLRPFWDDSAVVVLSDHGLVFSAETRGEVLDTMQSVLHPVAGVFLGRNVVKRHPSFSTNLQTWSARPTSHFDIFATCGR
jgi:hypothetical protein